MAAKSDDQYLPARAKLWIASIDDPKVELRAQYNPKELQIDKQLTWGDHKDHDNRSGQKRQDSSKQSDLEFTGTPKRSMSIELLFDGYEGGESVEPDVEKLEQLSTVRDPESPKEELRRPHHCLIAWGSQSGGLRPFRCVIESLSTKYTVWDASGTPLRATCTIKVKECEHLTGSKANPDYGLKPRDPAPFWDRAGNRSR
jgi:hypothetical protein